MAKPLISALAVAMAVAAGATAAPIAAAAAELAVPGRVAHWRHHRVTCWDCCCFHMRYVYHRELRSTYGIGFDPRNFDTTEPHYYFGRVRAYPRYWVEAGPVQ